MLLRIISFFILCNAITDGLTQRNCQIEDITFEKVLGVKPADSNNPLLLLRGDGYVPVTVQCLQKCQAQKDCASFVVYYDVNTCYWFKTAIQGVQEAKNELNQNAAWFVKVCLHTKNDCENTWTFERFPGATLVGSDTKTLPSLHTRTECQQYCLNETSFPCRSAKFRIQSSDYGPNQDVTGICILSDVDRHVTPNAFRVSNYNDEYFENECAEPVLENPNEYCSYEEYDNSTLSHSDVLFANQTKNSCQDTCEELLFFNCRGYSLVPKGNFFDCFLHSEDSMIYGPRLIKTNVLGTYFERAQCLNLTVVCSETYITVDFTPKINFIGKMYMEGYSEQQLCSAKGEGKSTVELKLPAMSDQCGILKAIAPDERSLITGTMIIQYNPLVQTQGDRTIRIGCIYGNDTNTLIAGTGITITTGPNKGSPLFNSSGIVTPTVQMRVLDLATQREVSSTELGQDLELVIEVTPVQGIDIWAGHLLAMTEKSDESILLLDDSGCPTSPNIFPALTKTNEDNTIRLDSNFKAFRFSSSPVVRFSVIVQFCANSCPEMNCSTTRRKRSLDTVDGTKVININRTQFENDSKIYQMPLEFVMLVRKSPGNAEKLVLGDGRILIAGYDITTNEVCLDYSLFIGLIILWVLIQIIFITCCLVLVRRYKKLYEKESASQSMENLHKNFGFGYNNHFYDSRRVHWADNGESL